MIRLAAAFVALFAAGCATFHSAEIQGAPKGSTFASIDGARVRFVDRGHGPAVVLVHGFASSLDAWETVVPELEKTHRVIALDLKGFGYSSRPEGDYSPDAEAALVQHLADARGVDRFAVVAHSWGSSVALALALKSPERVTRIALYDAWVYEEQLPTMFVMARADGVGEALFNTFYTERADEKLALAFYDKSKVSEELAEKVEEQIDRPGTVAAALAAVRGQRFSAMQQKYRTIQQPTLLLWGREDSVTRLSFGERLSNEMPHARLVVYPRCGHFPMIEAKGASNAELVKFLEGDEPAAAPAPPAAPPAPAPATPPPAPATPPDQPKGAQ